MPLRSALAKDRLSKLQRPEGTILRNYKEICSRLADTAINDENPAMRIAASRVIQEYVIKPLKEQYLLERDAAKENGDSTPRSVNIAVSNLPVGAAAQVQIVNTGQQAQTQHNGPSRKESITLPYSPKPLITQDDSLPALAPRGGEAAEKPGAALTNVDSHRDFLDISNECGTNVSGTGYKPECLDTLRMENVRLKSDLDSLRNTCDGLRKRLTSESASATSTGTPSSSISGEQVKTYEDAHDDRSPTIRRCPDCLALWKRDKAKKAEMGRRCLACGSDISNRNIKAVRCFRCAKAKRNQENVDWQRTRREMAAKRKADADL